MGSKNPTTSLTIRTILSLVMVAVFIASGLGIFAGLRSLRKSPEQGEQTPRRPSVRVVTIERSSYREQLTGYGRAHALRAAQVASEVSGIIEWISPQLEAGATVEKGDELVRIDSRDLAIMVARARAELGQAKARRDQTRVDNAGIVRRLEVARKELATSRAELERSQSLVTEDIVSVSELDQQRRATQLLERQELQLETSAEGGPTRLAGEEADVARAQSVLDAALLDLDRAMIRAPYCGRITARTAEPGSRVAPGTLLFDLVDLSLIEVPVALPASRFGEVQVGRTATIRLTEGGEIAWEGNVARVSPVVDPVNRIFNAYLEVSGAEQTPVIPPGAFVVATIEGRVFEEVMAVPRVAFVGDRVYVVERDGEQSEYGVAVRRIPHVVRMLPDVALVDTGLEPGDEIIVTNLERIAQQTLIRVATLDSREPERGVVEATDVVGGPR